MTATLMLCALLAEAGTRTESQQLAFDAPLSPALIELTFAPADELDGARPLERVTIEYDVDVILVATVENGASFASPSLGITLIADTNLTATDVGLVGEDRGATGATIPAPLAPSDGVPGEGDDFFAFPPITIPMSASRTFEIVDGEPSVFLGKDAWSVMPFISSLFTVSGQTNLSWTFSSFFSAGTVRVEYEFAAASCPWDCTPADGNGVVNIDDLLAVLDAFGQPGGPCDVAPSGGDGTFGNGIVNIDDLFAVIQNFGDCL